jgi:hypothetical protein
MALCDRVRRCSPRTATAARCKPMRFLNLRLVVELLRQVPYLVPRYFT